MASEMVSNDATKVEEIKILKRHSKQRKPRYWESTKIKAPLRTSPWNWQAPEDMNFVLGNAVDR